VTTINPETQIVASSYDEQTRICSYTYEHSDGSRYTVAVPIDELHAKGQSAQRRQHLAMKIQSHIQANPPDAAAEPVPNNEPV
jgi:hypothetical protein